MNEEHEQEFFPYSVYKVPCSGMENLQQHENCTKPSESRVPTDPYGTWA